MKRRVPLCSTQMFKRFSSAPARLRHQTSRTRFAMLLLLALSLCVGACAKQQPPAPTAAPVADHSTAPAASGQSASALSQAPFHIEIQGMLLYRGRISLAPNFICVARLVDITDEHDIRELDRVVIPGPLHIPSRFSLGVDGYSIDPAKSYAVEAFIFAPADAKNPDPANGTMLLRSMRPVPVLTKGHTAHAEVHLTMQTAPPEQTNTRR